MRITKEVEQWFDIPKDPDKGKVKIKYLDEGHQQELVQEAFEVNNEAIKDDVEKTIVKQNPKKLREAIVRERITDWENFYDVDDNLAECNLENKIIQSRQKGFMKLIDGFIKKLDKQVEGETKKEVKNSKRSQDGSAK